VNIVDIRSTILAVFVEVARDQRVRLVPLTDDLPLIESGLDSLCIATIVTRLEETLGCNPFDTDEQIDFPVTVGDFIRLYADAILPRAS